MMGAIVDDFSNDMYTTGNLVIGGSIKGEIETAGDADWIRVYLVAGTTVRFDLLGALGQGGTLGASPFEAGSLRLYDEDGSFLMATDTVGENGEAELEFTAINSGYFYIEIAEKFGNGVGTYTLKASELLSSDSDSLTITQFDPLPNSKSVDILSDLSFSFNAEISPGTGMIYLKLLSGEIVESFDVVASKALTFNKNTLIINPISNLNYDTAYLLEFSPKAIFDSNDREYTSASQFSFTTRSQNLPLTITGTDVSDFLFGTTGDDIMVGGAGNDTLSGAGGKDTIDGGSGLDVAVFNNRLASFSLRRIDDAYVLTGKDELANTVTILKGTESLKFSDMTVNLTIQSLAAKSPIASVQRLMELYVAFFNRVPDADGLAYWIGEMNAGQTINQIANNFYNAGIAYSDLTGFSADMTNAAFINVIYKNVLGRADGADAGGMAYWSAELASGKATRGTLVSTILDSAHTFKGDKTWGFVADLLDNKIVVAKTFAIDWGLSFNSDAASISQGKAIALAVTSTDTSAALALVGISPLDMILV